MTARFLFDHHVSVPAMHALRAHGVDVINVAEAALARSDDAAILLWAQHEGRIVVTRNYQDFAPLATAMSSRGAPFSGVLFIATSIRHSDVGAHVRTLEAWIAKAESRGATAVDGAFAWLR